MAVRAIRSVRPPGAAAVAAVSGLLLIGCAAGTTQATQQEAISRALVAASGHQIVVPYTAGGCVHGAPR